MKPSYLTRGLSERQWSRQMKVPLLGGWGRLGNLTRGSTLTSSSIHRSLIPGPNIFIGSVSGKEFPGNFLCSAFPEMLPFFGGAVRMWLGLSRWRKPARCAAAPGFSAGSWQDYGLYWTVIVTLLILLQFFLLASPLLCVLFSAFHWSHVSSCLANFLVFPLPFSFFYSFFLRQANTPSHSLSQVSRCSSRYATIQFSVNDLVLQLWGAWWMPGQAWCRTKGRGLDYLHSTRDMIVGGDDDDGTRFELTSHWFVIINSSGSWLEYNSIISKGYLFCLL